MPTNRLTGHGGLYDLVHPRTFALWFRMDTIPDDHNYFLSISGQIGPKTWAFVNVHQRKVYCWGGEFRDKDGKMPYNRGLKTQAYHIPGNGNNDRCDISDFFEQCPTGRWHQIVLSSTRNAANFYLNGKQFSSITHAKPITSEANLRNFGFARDGDVRVDGAVVFEGALSADQIGAAYRRGRKFLERKEDMKQMFMALSLGAVVTSATAVAETRETDQAAKTVFAVPVTETEPSMTAFNPTEWRDAVKFPAFHVFRTEGCAESRRAEMYVTVSTGAFHSAIVTECAPDGSLMLSGKKDVSVMQDDVVELFLCDDANDITYQVMAASDGRVCYNAKTYQKHQPPVDWKRFVRIKNLRVGKDWIVLMRIDSAIGARKTTEGEWSLGGARDWQRPFHFTCAPTWSYGGAKMRFAKGNPAVQFTFTEPPYNKNTITGRLTVRNTADRPKKYKAVLRVPSDGMPEDTVEKTLDIAPGETSELTIDSGSIKISNVRYEFHIEVSDESGYLYRQGFNWRKPFNEPIWDVSDKPPLPFDFMFAFYPTGSKLRLTTVVRATKNVPENVTYAVREATSGKDVARVDVPAKDGVETWIQLPELDGDYVIGQIAGKTVEKKTFERHRFVWEGNSLGKSRKVYAPFTPIDVDGKVLKTVLREHSLGENGLPAQIKADGRDLMAAPIRLVANGKEVTASLSFVEKSDDRVITKSTLKGERFVGEAIATWEYDGCLKYELLLKEGTLNDLTLEMPFKDAEATCLHALGVMRATDTLRLPAREGVIWDTTHLKTLVLANFANYVFIGNAFRGLAYWAENDKGWGWDRSTANTDVVRKGEVVTARLHLVNKTTSINEPRRILLGFQAGPVKPARPLWKGLPAKGRMLWTDCRWIGGPGDCGSHAPFDKDIRFFEFIRDIFLPGHPKPDKAFKDELHAKVDAVLKDYRGGKVYAKKLKWSIDWLPSHWRADGKQERPVFYYNRAVWNHLEEFRTYMNEWSSENTCERGQKPCVDEVNVTMVDTFLDFVLYYYKLSFDYGNAGVYCDNYYPRPTWNLAYPEAYRDPESGKIVGAAAIWTMREHAKRVFVMMNERSDIEPFFYPHMTSAQILPLMGFAQAQLDWEDKGGMGPVQTRFSPEFVQMVSSGLIVGACPELLSDRGVPKVDKEFVARTYCAVPLVHGIPYGGNPKLAPWANYLRDDYCRNQKLDLHRYFDDGDPVVKVSDPDVKWCLYRIPDGKTAILFVSYADRPLTCTFEVADSLGLKGKKITDLDTKASGSHTLHFKRGYEIICLEFEPKRSN
ncbi:MAG TPA: DUF6067 family protein [Candidatus Latescibacteria bacterium]|nr:DUF6067 family protein [Candidatus Latescibacterota bacterium]HRU19616.1 DUF6067 family protein [Kiritimatiellia bacterium]